MKPPLNGQTYPLVQTYVDENAYFFGLPPVDDTQVAKAGAGPSIDGQETIALTGPKGSKLYISRAANRILETDSNTSHSTFTDYGSVPERSVPSDSIDGEKLGL